MGAAFLPEPHRAGIDVVVATPRSRLSGLDDILPPGEQRRPFDTVVNPVVNQPHVHVCFVLIDPEFDWPIFRL
jgi:hypothetical protein